MNRSLLFLSALFICNRLLAGDVYVSPTGSDTGPGTKDHPFRTLERARDAIRGEPRPATVWLRGGDYILTQSFVLGPRDGGSDKAPVTYRGMDGETVTLHGALPAEADRFQPVTDPATLARIDPALRGKVVALDLAGVRHAKPFPDLFTDSGGLPDLFVDGARMPLARYPHRGYMTIKRVLDNAGGLVNGDWGASQWTDMPANGKGGTFEYREEVYDRFAQWQRQLNRGLWLKGYWRIPWENEAIRVASIDTAAHTVTFAKAVPGGIGSKYHRPAGSGKETYWLLNLLEAIAAPGDWCVDFKDHKLYLLPPRDLASSRIALADSDEPVIHVDGASHVTLRGLTIEEALGDGIRITGGEDVLVAGCTVREVDKYAVVVDGGKNHTVLSNDLYNLGEGGVWLGGGDDQARPRVAAGHRVINNHIHHFSQITRVYTPAVNSGYVGGNGAGHHPAVGMLVAHNLIHDTPHAGVLTGSYDSVFEYNEVFRFALVSNDIGAFYCFDDQRMDAHRTFRYNLIHDSEQGDALYFDRDHQDMDIYGNIVCLRSDSKRGAGLIFKDGTQKASPPQRSRIHDNLFMQCSQGALIFGARPEYNQAWNNVISDCKSAWDWRVLDAGKWRQLAGYAPAGNLVCMGNPGFANPARLDFHLARDAQVYESLPAFAAPPATGIGLYVDEYRKRLPTDAEIERYSPSSSETETGDEILDRK